MHERAHIVVNLTLAAVLVLMLSFGGLFHALLPHQHSQNEAIAESLHSALVHYEQDLDFIALAAGSALLFALFLLRADTQRVRALSSIAVERSSKTARLRRGIVAYRKFR